MGIDSINCEGRAETGKSIFGEGCRSASDFEGAGLVTATAVVALFGLAAIGVRELMDQRTEAIMKPLVKDGDFRGYVDAELNATKIGDNITYENGGRYDVMFRGMGSDGKAHFDILKDNNELKQFTVGNYEKPATYEKMLNMTDKLMAGESTDSVALLKFEETGRYELLAYAYINGSEADLKLVDLSR